MTLLSLNRSFLVISFKSNKNMKKGRLIEIGVKMIVAALTAFLTALTTTSCMGHGPLF